MLRAIIETITAEIEDAGIPATADSRNLNPPGCFVTVTQLAPAALADCWQVTGQVLAVARDLGGMADIDALSDLLDVVVDTLVWKLGATIENIDTNQQVTPPTGGTLPAANLTFTMIIEKETH